MQRQTAAETRRVKHRRGSQHNQGTFQRKDAPFEGSGGELEICSNHKLGAKEKDLEAGGVTSSGIIKVELLV